MDDNFQFRHPFQRLCCLGDGADSPTLLLAAAGPSIFSFDLVSGNVLSIFSPGVVEDQSEFEEHENEDRPAKRRKTENGAIAREDSEESIEIVAERQKGQRRKPKIEDTKPPNISHMVCTSDGHYLITVTAEDKSVKVFEVQRTGRFILKSHRTMPKRLCAIVLTPDEKTIVAGDKFGDVYALPIHPSQDYQHLSSAAGLDYKPAATELTVHTKGNLAALRQQLEQKKVHSKKEAPTFEHRVLLGHVSLLTDVAIVEVQSGSRSKQFILTSDRDEHIRVSRGISQAHIIHNYCLGHRDFVSKLCILPWNPDLLVAGSGEPSLKIYHWNSGRLLDQEPFTGAIKEDIVLRDDRSVDRLAVSGIWPVDRRLQVGGAMSQLHCKLILVALEGLPILFSYIIQEEGRLQHHQTIELSGNVLDVVLDPNQCIAIASIDTFHKPGSLQMPRPRELPDSEMFEVFELFATAGKGDDLDMRWETSSLAIALNTSATDQGTALQLVETKVQQENRKSDTHPLTELLYGLENLRKKRLHGDEGQGQDEAEDEHGEE